MRFSMHLAAFLAPVFKRWATYLDMCLQPVGNTTGSQVILWNCRRRSLVFECLRFFLPVEAKPYTLHGLHVPFQRRASGNSRVVLPSGELRTVRTPMHGPHYVAAGLFVYSASQSKEVCCPLPTMVPGQQCGRSLHEKRTQLSLQERPLVFNVWEFLLCQLPGRL